MIRHIVLWNLNAEAKAKGAATVAAELQKEFNKLIEGIEGLQLGKIAPNNFEGGYDIMLYTEMKDFDALAVYQPHPLHQAFKKIVGSYTSGERTVVDCEA